MTNTGQVLQTVALTLPAVALYMGVLSEIYEDAAEASSLYPDPESDAFQGPGPATGKMDQKVHRGWVTLSTVMDGWDFRAASVSLLLLTMSAVLLLPTFALDIQPLYWGGLATATAGFAALTGALCYTVYATIFEKYPRS